MALSSKSWLSCFAMLVLGADAFFGSRSTVGTQGLARHSDVKADNHEEVALNLDRSRRTSGSDISLPDLIIQQLKSQEAFSRVQHTINSYTTESTCNKAAYSSLTHSCSTLEHDTARRSTDSIDSTLEMVKSIFAARLAICELLEVGKDIVPTACSFLLHDIQAKDTHDAMKTQIDTRQMKSCLRGMHDDTRAWNSFSNAKQNAIKICHATRTRVERDIMLEQLQHIIRVYGESSEATANVTRTMMETHPDFLAARDRLAESTELTSKLMTDYRAEYERHLEEWAATSRAAFEAARQSYQALFRDVVADSQAAYHGMLDLVNKQADSSIDKFLGLSTSLESLQREVSNFSGSITSLDKEIGKMVDSVVPLNGELEHATEQFRQLGDSFTTKNAEIERAQEKQLAQVKEVGAVVEKLVTAVSAAWEYFGWLCEVSQFLKRFCLYVVPVVAIMGFLLACLGLHRLALKFLMRPIYEIWRGFHDADGSRFSQDQGLKLLESTG